MEFAGVTLDGSGSSDPDGVIAAYAWTQTAGPAVVLGIGLNVTLRADELPPPGSGLRATSLQLAGAAATDRDPLLRAVLRGVADWYGRWRAAGGDPVASGLRAAYLRHCVTVGRQVRVSGRIPFTVIDAVEDADQASVPRPQGVQRTRRASARDVRARGAPPRAGPDRGGGRARARQGRWRREPAPHRA